MRPLDVLRSWAVQDSPPGAAIAAIVARAPDTPVGWLDEAPVVALYNPRTATAVVPEDEVAAFGTAFLPPDDAALKAIVDSALPTYDEGFAEPVQLAVDAISDALDGRELSRDDLHERLRQTLPEALLPWCEGCQSHHARRGLLVMAALNGRLCVSGRAGRQPAFSRTDQLHGWDPPPREQAGAELVRRYRRTYGATSTAHFAEWAGLGRKHAQGLWELVDDAPRRGPLTGLRVLAPGDPVLLGRDRETLLPDAAARRKVWAPIGGMGLVLLDGDPVALWRGRKKGKKLEVSVEALAKTLPKAEIETQLERLAPHRGCTSVALTFTS
jgi:hypothetical protein